MKGGVVLFIQCGRSNLTEACRELMGIGTRLADDLDGPLTAVVVGDEIGKEEAKAICSGVNRAIVVKNSELQNYDPDLYGAVLEKLCREIAPTIVLFNHDRVGADLAPRLAVRMKTGVILDCVDLSINKETKRLAATKPVYGGSILAVYSSVSDPQLASIREKVFPPLDLGKQRSCEIEVRHPELDYSLKRIKVLETVKEELAGPKLEDADVIICGGRGIGSAEEFSHLSDLAKILGGALAGTRPSCEKGWIHPRQQIGLTGVKVAPKLYIAVGVSGAIQHMAGVIGAKTIVAINKDPDANIFREAHYGVVGDFKEILPSFLMKLKA